LYFDNVHFATGDAGAPPVLTGLLVDAALEGVTFQTATQSGVTNNLGEFKYIQDEDVTFSVGGIVLGTVTGAPLITPVELTGGANPIDQAATNQLVFLQSIDVDQDPLNGVTVSAASQTAAATQTLDFTLDSAAFTAAVTPVVTAITNVNPVGPNPVVSETTALDNFYVTYVASGGTDTFPWSFPPQYPPYPGMASFPVDFEDAGGPYYISNFAGGVTTIISNPQTTGNSSAKVAQMQKFSDTNNFGGSTLTLGTIDFSAAEVFTMKVWASRAVPVTFKLEGLGVERIATHSGSSTWEELSFDFTGFTGQGVREISVIFDNGVVGDAAGDAANWTFYYDDITLQSSAPITYQLIWSDEFDVDGVPDTDNWVIETGYGDNGWGNNEWQLYTTSPDNVRVESDNLVITADCPTAPCGVRDGTVTSGRINSLNKFSFRYGKVEARIKPPVGKASWPAFWMLGKNFPEVGWPKTGEVDIVEMFQTNGSDANTTHFTVHYFDDTGSFDPSCLTSPVPGHVFCTDQLRLSQSLGDDYHVFSAEWDATGITGKIDGVPYFYKAIDPGTMDEFLKEFFLILNVAMGGTLGSNSLAPDGSETWPQTMLVDYVRVYQDVNNSDSTFTIGGGAPLDPLGVYSETYTNPALAYAISIAPGGKDTIIEENSTTTVLEGSFSFKAEYKSTGSGPLNWNGFDFDFGSAGGSNLLLNGNIEAVDASGGDISGVFDWTTFETVFTNSTIGPAFGPVSHDAGGTQSIKMYGPFNPNGAAGAYQPVDVTAGRTYDLTAYAMSWDPDPVGLGNVGILQLTFWDGPGASGNQLGGNIEFFVDSDPSSANTTLTPQDGADISDWTEMSVSGVAPAGAVSAQAFLLHIQSGAGGVGGSIFFDDVSLSEAAVAGGADISGYDTLKFGINTSAASGLKDLEVKMEDPVLGSASVFLSAYMPSASGVANWDIYEIPLSDFVGVDKTQITSLGFWSASSTITGSTAVAPTLLDGIIYFDDIHFKVGLPVGGGPNLLLNGNIEAVDASGGDISGVFDWTTFETVFTNSTIGPAFGPVSHDAGGTQSIKMYGPFNPNGAAGAYQPVNVTAGETYDLTAYAMSWDPDPVGLGNVGILQLTFWDGPGASGNQLGGNIEFVVDSDPSSANTTLMPQDGADISDWTEMSVSGVAPPGAVSAQAFLLHIQSGAGGVGGSIFFDDVSLRAR
ncbi:MAG: family 16 glycosylhydrolase, partial [Gammaproteobacteria bacterium]|nr:family 16 glycosylhydrolase [Gammaproteobacteria bacterium]NNJ50320.1 glycoside hydrolase family 16 protein [Gammaproteobacteria bacterium]